MRAMPISSRVSDLQQALGAPKQFGLHFGENFPSTRIVGIVSSSFLERVPPSCWILPISVGDILSSAVWHSASRLIIELTANPSEQSWKYQLNTGDHLSDSTEMLISQAHIRNLKIEVVYAHSTLAAHHYEALLSMADTIWAHEKIQDSERQVLDLLTPDLRFFKEASDIMSEGGQQECE